MEIMDIVDLTKQVLGIMTDKRDNYLKSRVEATIYSLEKTNGIKIDLDNLDQCLFLADYAAYQYNSKDNNTGVPRNLQWRFRNLWFGSGT